MNKRICGHIIKKARSVSCPFIACLKDCKETHCFMSLSKLFQILVPLYANVRWLVAVLYKGICNKSPLRVWQAWILERLVNLSSIFRCETIKT